MRLRLTTLVLVVLLTASGIAAGQEPTASPPNPLAGVTFSCSLGAPSWVAGCFAETPRAYVGPLSLALGLDGQLDVDELLAGELSGTHVAPYLVGIWTVDEYTAVWGELALPADVVGIPAIGRPDFARVGFTITVPP